MCYIFALSKVFAFFRPFGTFLLRTLFHALLIVWLAMAEPAHVAGPHTAGAHTASSSTMTATASAVSAATTTASSSSAASPCRASAAQK